MKKQTDGYYFVSSLLIILCLSVVPGCSLMQSGLGRSNNNVSLVNQNNSNITDVATLFGRNIPATFQGFTRDDSSVKSFRNGIVNGYILLCPTAKTKTQEFQISANYKAPNGDTVVFLKEIYNSPEEAKSAFDCDISERTDYDPKLSKADREADAPRYKDEKITGKNGIDLHILRTYPDYPYDEVCLWMDDSTVYYWLLKDNLKTHQQVEFAKAFALK